MILIIIFLIILYFFIKRTRKRECFNFTSIYKNDIIINEDSTSRNEDYIKRINENSTTRNEDYIKRINENSTTSRNEDFTIIHEDSTTQKKNKDFKFFSKSPNANIYLDNKKEMQQLFKYDINDNINPHKKFDDEKNIINMENKAIKEVYDESLENYKTYDKKLLINERHIEEASSNLTYLNPNDWVYDNEEILNGGNIIPGLYPNDEFTLNTNAIFTN